MRTPVLALILVSLTLESAALAQRRGSRRIQFSPPRQSDDRDPLLRKLAPGLQVAVQKKAIFVGKSIYGDMVLQDPGEDTSDLENVNATGGVDDEIRQLIVSYEGKERPTDAELSQAGFNVLDDVKDSEFLVVTPKALTAREQQVHRASGVSHNELMGLAALKQIGSIEANFAMSIPEPQPAQILSAEEAVTLLDNSSELGPLWGIRDTKAPEVPGFATPKREIIVAVIDTGVDYTHPDLVDNMWVNEREQNGRTGVDDDGNGVIDDVYGASFVNNGKSGDPMDDQGHGTHCAGTVAGVANGTGVIGMAQVKIMALKFLGRNGSGSTSDAIKCINYARMMGAHILSNSWGSAGNVSPTLLQAIRQAQQNDLLFIAAAGNSNQDNDRISNSPSNAEVPNVIAVGSINFNDGRSRFSNFGLRTVDIGAPGGTSSGTRSEDILSTYLNHKYAYLAGTSMATPHVSGAAALIMASPQYQDASYLTIRNAILDNARPNGALRQFWPEGRELDVSFLTNGSDDGSGRDGAGSGGGDTTEPQPVPPIASGSNGQFYHRSGQTITSKRVLTSRTITLDSPAIVVIQAGSSATMDRKPATFATGLSIGSQPQKASYRLATTTARNHYLSFGTSLTTRLPAGTHRIEWWVNVSQNASVIVRGGGSLDVQAFEVNE